MSDETPGGISTEETLDQKKKDITEGIPGYISTPNPEGDTRLRNVTNVSKNARNGQKRACIDSLDTSMEISFKFFMKSAMDFL